MVKLSCVIVGVAGNAFPVNIDAGETVGDLKNAIKEARVYQFPADELQLFLAKTDCGAWLKSKDLLQMRKREISDEVENLYMKEELEDPTDKICAKLPSTIPDGTIHVLAKVPEQEHAQTGVWLVTGSVENALNTKGIRCRLYRLAGSYLGYYDPNPRAGESDKAFWYDGAMLRINVLFKEERDALLFENELRAEGIKPTSPLDGHMISTTVASLSRELSELRRIFSPHYVPGDTDSPQVSMTSFSSSTSIVDVATDEFKYQRIESEDWFGSVGKAQSCHVMSREHCNKYPSYKKYDNDSSNRLALSAEMHEWFDAESYEVPTMKISVESASEGRVIGNRYKVNLVVRALDDVFARLISLRLKEGFVVSDDGLEMRTSVYVQNKKVFCECMEWKCKEVENKWREYDDMAPAVD